MTKLNISPTLALPLDFVTSTQAILAKKGKGKTYKAAVQAEELLDKHQQIVAIDPTGAWWGLRSSADGKSGGYPVTIFGGEHADVPLETTAGEVIADAIATEHFSAIIDLSLFRKGEALRFMAAFLETLYRKNRAALHLFIDEADVVAPQKTFSPEQARALGATDDLVRRGRIRGIGCTLITQRPQVLNKDVLSQIDMLTALGMNHPKDIGAIKDWVAVHGDEAQAKQMIADLPALPVGEAWVWAPAAGIFKRVTFRDRHTFDSGRTPKAGEKIRAPKVLAPIDLARLGRTIAATVEQQKANDPKALKARVAELEKDLTRQRIGAKEARLIEKIVEKSVVGDAQIRRLEQLAGRVEKLVERAFAVAASTSEAQGNVVDAAKELHKSMCDMLGSLAAAKQPSAQNIRAPGSTASTRPPSRIAAPATARRPNRVENIRASEGEPACTGALRRIMVALAQHPGGLTDSKIGVYSGVSTKGGSFRTYLSRARGAGWIEDLRDVRRITDRGLAAVGDFQPLPTGLKLAEYWMHELGGSTALILEVLINAYPHELDHATIGERAGVSIQGGSYRTYLSRLRSRDLIEDVHRGAVKAADALFEVSR